jgi:UPF0042 nucleotide-binding protein
MTSAARPQPAPPAARREGARAVLVTGPSGAGRSTAIRALEDLGYETIDNLPLSLVPRVLEGPLPAGALALGLAPGNRDFSPEAVLDLVDGREGPGLELLFLDCRPDVLIRRYSETRRRHPAAPAEEVATGIAREADLLGPLRTRADILIDTSDLTLHDLKAEIGRWFGGPDAARLAVAIHSFSYKRGLPRGIDTVFDCRFLRNPYWVDDLRPLDGRDPRVAAHVAGDPRFADFFAHVRGLADLLLPAHVEEGKAHLAIGFGCTGGRHRSVTVADRLAKALAVAGWQVSTRHRELERRAALGEAPQAGPNTAGKGPSGTTR